MKKLIYTLIAVVCCSLQANAQMNWSQGAMTLYVTNSYFHDSSSCATNISEMWFFTKTSSFVNDSVLFKDQNTGQLIAWAQNTTGASPWSGNFMAMTVMPYVPDYQLQGNNFFAPSFSTFKCISGVDTIYQINNMIFGTVANPCIMDSIQGKVYVDNNNDCVYNTGDVNLNGINIQSIGNFSPGNNLGNWGGSAYSNAIGNYVMPVYKSWMINYQVMLQNNYALLYPPSTCGATSYTVTSLPQTKDFALHCSSDIDVQATLAGPVAIRPTIPFVLHPCVSNTGCDSAAGVLTVVKNNHCNFNATMSINAPSSINGDTLRWNYANLSNLANGAYWLSFFSSLYFTPDTTLHFGDTACFSYYTTVAGNDVNAANNSGTLCLPIVNSYDPNIKVGLPKGVGTAGNIAPTTKALDYTIHFQNTGNAVAYNVSILDTLDTDLDYNSLVITGASHACTPQVDGKIIRFNFYNIMLADSFSNEPQSHGSISYKIKLKSNLPIGTQLKNTAHIYFDNNSPIVTNTTLHTLAIPAGIQDAVVTKHIKLYPNPTNNYVLLEKNNNADVVSYQLYNHLGNKISQDKLTNTITKIDMQHYAAGLYLVKIIVNGEPSVIKVIKE